MSQPPAPLLQGPAAWPPVTVIVLNYNGLRYLQDCCASLLALDYPREQLDLLVVDNGSTDGSVEFMAAHFPTIRVHPLEENLGFAAGNNAGAAVARGEYLAFLNNDTRVERSWLKELVRSLREDEPQGVVCTGAKMVSWDGTAIDFVGGVMNFHAFGWQEGYGLPLATEPPALFPPDPWLLPPCGAGAASFVEVHPSPRRTTAVGPRKRRRKFFILQQPRGLWK